MSNADVAAELTNGRGTGRWSDAMFLMFHLRCPDVWPTGDFSVRVGYGPPGESGPTPKAVDELGDPFRPYRSVAAYPSWKVSADPDLFACSLVRAVS